MPSVGRRLCRLGVELGVGELLGRDRKPELLSFPTFPPGAAGLSYGDPRGLKPRGSLGGKAELCTTRTELCATREAEAVQNCFRREAPTRLGTIDIDALLEPLPHGRGLLRGNRVLFEPLQT